MRKMKVAELVFDFNLYPRQQIDSQHVTYLAEAVDSGASMPPLVIEKSSKRIVDGFHRAKAYLRLFGTDAECEVVEKTYRNDKELFLDAMRFNAAHGRTLTRYDRVHCILLAEKLGIDANAVAGTLNLRADRLAELRTDRTAVVGNVTVALKRTIQHMAGKKLTKQQQECNTKLSGMNQLFYVNQLVSLLESNLIDKEDEELMEGLRKLGELIDQHLSART